MRPKWRCYSQTGPHSPLHWFGCRYRYFTIINIFTSSFVFLPWHFDLASLDPHISPCISLTCAPVNRVHCARETNTCLTPLYMAIRSHRTLHDHFLTQYRQDRHSLLYYLLLIMWIWRMDSFCKSLKIKKTIAYALMMFYRTEVLLKKVQETFLSSKVVFDVHYIRVFCKFPGWSLLFTTTMVVLNVCSISLSYSINYVVIATICVKIISYLLLYLVLVAFLWPIASSDHYLLMFQHASHCWRIFKGSKLLTDSE